MTDTAETYAGARTAVAIICLVQAIAFGLAGVGTIPTGLLSWPGSVFCVSAAAAAATGATLSLGRERRTVAAAALTAAVDLVLALVLHQQRRYSAWITHLGSLFNLVAIVLLGLGCLVLVGRREDLKRRSGTAAPPTGGSRSSSGPAPQYPSPAAQNLLKGFLVTTLLVGIAGIAVGLVAASIAASSAKRSADPLSGIGVAIGFFVAAVGGLLVLIAAVALFVRTRDPRPAQARRPTSGDTRPRAEDTEDHPFDG